MATQTLPKIDIKTSETGCCPKFDPTSWDDATFEFHQKRFAKSKTFNFMYVPLNIESVMNWSHKCIEEANAMPSDEHLVLSTCAPWRGEHYFSVTKDVPKMEMVELNGIYITKVFEGPYQKSGEWAREMVKFVSSKGKTIETLYFFYTTCPRCIEHYGKNYVVAFAQVQE